MPPRIITNEIKKGSLYDIPLFVIPPEWMRGYGYRLESD